MSKGPSRPFEGIFLARVVFAWLFLMSTVVIAASCGDDKEVSNAAGKGSAGTGLSEAVAWTNDERTIRKGAGGATDDANETTVGAGGDARDANGGKNADTATRGGAGGRRGRGGSGANTDNETGAGGKNDTGNTGNKGGAGGTPGAGGQGGSGGTAGSSAGAGGKAGSAGAGGQGGTAGTAGSGGTAGSSAGAGGQATRAPNGDFCNAIVEDTAAVPFGLRDPGDGAWSLVPEDQVPTVCELDVAKLKAAEETLNVPWLIIRHGLLCYQHDAMNFSPAEAWSTTKTLGALVTGIVAYRTRQLAPTGIRKNGPFSDMDRVDRWLDLPNSTYTRINKDAYVAHVLAMLAHNTSLDSGEKEMAYDTVGSTQINSVSDMLNAAIGQCSDRLGKDLEAFTKKFLYEPLGMTKSTWSGGGASKTFAYTWNTDLLDMARVGLLMLNRGVWHGKRIASEEWIYRMTHPSFEDANTGYGYLTWLNATSNHTLGGIGASVLTLDANGKYQEPYSPGPCAPVSIYNKFPHGLSTSSDCNYKSPATCAKKYDVGVWQAVGLQGQLIQGHPGLDMVIVARNLSSLDQPDAGAQSGDLMTGVGGPKVVWDALRPAVIAADPKHKGNEGTFCPDYGSNNYAPDFRW